MVTSCFKIQYQAYNLFTVYDMHLIQLNPAHGSNAGCIRRALKDFVLWKHKTGFEHVTLRCAIKHTTLHVQSKALYSVSEHIASAFTLEAHLSHCRHQGDSEAIGQSAHFWILKATRFPATS